MKPWLSILVTVLTIPACTPVKQISFSKKTSIAPKGSEFYKISAGYSWKERDSLAVAQIVNGNVPDFIREFRPIKTSITSPEGRKLTATYYVSPDYLSIGDNDDWARIPLTPMAAQIVADSLDCFCRHEKLSMISIHNPW